MVDSNPETSVASETATQSAVELDGVTRRYAETTAVDDVSFAVREGEFFTLVGPSGCGKTTTLRLVGGFESPTTGTVRLGGKDVSTVPPEDRDVGIVFQNYALFPHMSVRENIAYGLNFSDPPDGQSTEQRVEELLSLVDLDGMGERDPDQLSGGQKQRVALARALAPGPSVLLLDEPMSALDAELRERLRVELKELQQNLGVTTLYVTHDQEEALAISDRLAVMRNGAIEQIGTPREIYRRPRTRFVAEFIGDNNVFTGEVQSVSDGYLSVRLDNSAETTVTVEGGDEKVEEDSMSDSHEGIRPGSQVTFCVRPADLVIGWESNALEATVEGTEFLGETTRVHLDWNGTTLLVRGQTRDEEVVRVGFEPRDAHVVDCPRRR